MVATPNLQTAAVFDAFDWAGNPLGRPCDWPMELRTLSRLMLRSASPRHIVWGPERILLYNDGYIPVLGHKHPRAFAQRFGDVFPEVWDEIEPIVARTYAGEASYFENHPLVLDRGGQADQAWISFAYTPVEDEQGKVLGFHCTFHDTTERMLAAQALARVSEERYALARERQLAMDAARLGWWRFDPSNGLVRHDHRYAEIYGLAGGLERDVGEISRLLHPDDAPRLWEAVQAAMNPDDPKPYAIEYRINVPDGTLRWLEARGIASFEGEGAQRTVSDFVGTVADVTERRMADDVLRENEARFRLMADASPAALWLTDPDGYCTFLSRQWYQLTGQTEDEALGLGWTTATHPDDQEMAGKVFLDANAGRTFFRTEYRLRTSDGTYRWAVDLGRPWFSENGDYAGMVGVVFDIDDRKHAEQAVADASRRKDEFLGMLAHELRNPLAPIGTAAQLLKRTEDLDSGRASHFAEVIERQVGHLTSLVDDLLDVSRVTRGLVSIERKPVDTRAVVMAALEQAQPQINARSHTLNASIAPDELNVSGDFNRLVQIVANLLTNAAKYTPPHGAIEVGVSRMDDEVVITVTDNGVGIPAELLPGVFDLFTQAERTPDQAQGGLGIGLALVRSLVTLHGGSVTAASDGPQKGSTFTVRLPHSPTPVVPAVVDPATTSSVAPHRILIVDDNRDAAETLAELLRLLGNDVRIAADGASALRLATEFVSDTYILDIGLPDMTGLELAQRLRVHAVRHDATFIALTGYGQAQDLDQSVAAGFHHHMIKPPDISKLLSLIARRQP